MYLYIFGYQAKIRVKNIKKMRLMYPSYVVLHAF